MPKTILKFLLWGYILLVAGPANAILSGAEEFCLDNGMQVVVIPNHKAPIIKHIVLYKAGRIDEPQGKGGIAHLLEHLMFRGTQKFKDSEFNRIIEENGGVSNAGTGHNYTYYHQFLSLDRLELAMYLEADRMAGLSFNEETFKTEREVVYQERQERLNANPSRDFWEKTDKLFWQGSLFGEPVGGTASEIQKITRQDILDFYRNFYAPDNAVLILAGDIDTQTARDLAQKYYGKIKPHNAAKKENNFELNIDKFQQEQYTIRAERKDLHVGRLLGRYMLPRYQGNDSSLYAMIILADYLGNSVSSPLYKQLRIDNQLVTSLGVSFDFLSRGNSTLSFYAHFKDKNNAQTIQNIFIRTIEQTKNNITEQDLQKAKKRLLSGMIYANDNPESSADIAVSWIGSGYTLQNLKNYEERINQVTLKQIKQCAEELKKYYPLWAAAFPLTEEKP